MHSSRAAPQRSDKIDEPREREMCDGCGASDGLFHSSLPLNIDSKVVIA